jgi:hypothetical protein
LAIGRSRRGDGAVDAREDFRQPCQDRAQAHHRHVLHRELRDESLLRHQRATHADVAYAPAAARVQYRHELGAQRIARMLARNDEQPQVLALGRDDTLFAGLLGS